MIFEEYIKLLESFKHNQISKLIERVETEIFEVLYSKRVSPRIAPYFPRYELCFMSDETELEPGKVYIREQQGKVAYSLITPSGEPVNDVVLEELKAPSTFKYNLALMSNGVKPKKDFFYVRMLDDALEYTVINPQGRVVTDLIKKEDLKFKLSSDESGFSPKDLEPFMAEILKITSKRKIKSQDQATTQEYHTHPFTLDTFRASVLSATSRKGHTKWAPFTDYELDPDNISQIKKLINALHFARLTFLDLEKIDVRSIQNGYPGLKLLYENTINLAYEASYLATHLDVDLRDMFREELSIILPLLSKIQNFAENHTKMTEGITKRLKATPLSYKAGEIAGIAVDQMRPIGGDIDYSFLTQFSAVLPSYLDKLTQYIQQYTTQIDETGDELSPEKQSKLNKEKLDELRNAALNLLNDLENLKGNSLFVSLRFLNYIHIIRNIITLSMSSLDQIGAVSESSQDLIRDKLAQIKYTLLPTLFALVDKVEDNAMLKPGTLSVPLMEKVKALYRVVIYLPKKVVDFKAKGEELLGIEDSRFIELRLEMAYKRIDKANKALNRIEKAQKAFEQFFIILNTPLHNGIRLYQFPPEVRKELIKHYKLIKPYMTKLDIDLNNMIIDTLNGPQVESWYSYLAAPMRYVAKQLPADHIDHVLAQQKALHDLIAKDEKSQLFHINLNKDLIDSVHEKGNLVLFPYSEKASVYVLDESIPLQIEQENEKKLKVTPTQFKAIQDAYTQFSQLVKKHIEKQSKQKDDILTLNTLDKKTKEQCHQLYKIFQPYFSKFLLPEQEDEIQSFEHYLEAVFTNKPLNIKKTPANALFLILDQNVHDFFVRINKELAEISKAYAPYYNFTTGKFLNEEESKALKSKRDNDAKLKFKKTDEGTLLENSEQLTSDQAFELGQWYRNKHNKFLVTQDAYTKFCNLLKSEIGKLPKVEGNTPPLTKLDKKVKDECRNLYSIFQPYFIGAVPPEKKDAALKLDKYLVALLSVDKDDPSKDGKNIGSNLYSAFKSYITPSPPPKKEQAPSIEEFLELDLQEYFAGISMDWHRKSQAYNELAQEKFVPELDATKLERDPNIGARAHYLIQHTNYSKCVHEFRLALFATSTLFNKSMQAQLTPKSSGVPYPEMEDDNTRLAQSRQVCALKDIYNSLYHLEGIVLELEKLNDKSYKSLYVSHLLSAYGHINQIIKLSKRLASDPHMGFVARELMDKAQTLYATFQEHSDAYQVDAAEVQYGTAEVQYNPLWYVLNAFYISPKHIRALKNSNYLTTEELNGLHLGAKKATLIIEGLINSSDSYFKLFLQTPNMIYLYQEMTKKLNEFTTTTHDAVLDNLDQVRSSVFTPMLLEADRYEDKLGLIPGSLSGPLKKITDEFFKGLLHPLDLNSKMHIELIGDKAPLETRSSHVKKQISNAKRYLKKIDKDYKDIEDLYELIQRYKQAITGFVPPSEFLMHVLTQQVQQAYRNALPKLAKLKLDKKIEIAPSQYAEDHKFDALCNEGLKDYDPQYAEVEALITASHHYYLGLRATHQMRAQIEEEKLAYLTSLGKQDELAKLIFIEDYTTEAFVKYLTIFCNRHIGLQYTDKEYQAKLKAYLLEFKAEIINKSKKAEDINLSIKKLLKEKISVFEKDHYEEYYHLDAVRVAVYQFKNYFYRSTVAIANKDSVFENNNTLKEKTDRINILDAIAQDTNLEIKDRLAQIKVQVQDSNFARIILKHKETNKSSKDELDAPDDDKNSAQALWTYLKLCFFSLFEALGLYTPTRMKLLNQIDEAVNNPPKINELTKRFGLFATTKEPDEQAKRYEVPSLLSPAQ